ncbi:MAG: peptidylprolyl isomerase [Polyangiaceae bacterium]|nr:peptidylprolyl isomerase [Polyangiaceae bacterium]
MAATLATRLHRALCLLVASGALGCLLPSCHRRSAGDHPAASSRSKPAPRGSSREQQLLVVEQRRDSQAILAADLASRSVSVRRAAVRALARTADDHALPLLERALHDEDPDVVAWAAQGLGASCTISEDSIVRRLVARAASFVSDELGNSPARPSEPQELDPRAAIAASLGRCATPQAERTLKAWLSGPRRRAEAAALGLGVMATRRKALQDVTLVALLDRAADDTEPLDNALAAFTRLPSVHDALRKRLLEVAGLSLEGSARRRALAVRALGRSGEAAVALLESVALDPQVPSYQRADAVRELGRLQEPGQLALRRALDLLGRAVEAGKLDLLSSDWGVLSAVIEAVRVPLGTARSSAGALAELSVPPDPAPRRRRAIRLRCAAASWLAGDNIHLDKLALCDPDGAREGKLALIRVLDRGRLVGERYRRWRELVDDRDALVQEASLQLVAAHDEVTEAAALLAKALGSDHLGVVATAAHLLAARPDRGGVGTPATAAHEPTLRPDPAIIHALENVLSAARAPDAVATTAALFDAVGSLQLLSLKALLERECVGTSPMLRDHAARALKTLGQRDVSCLPATSTPADPTELARLVTRPVTLRFDTELGELRLSLDPTLAPVSTTRIVELAESGFYDALTIHRVVPGFIVQFGDRDGDGYGSAGRPALRDEISPRSFEPSSVGLALSGPDTGSSQLFVTLGPYPHLDGEYPLLGKAGPGWDRLSEGDVIRKVHVER